MLRQHFSIKIGLLGIIIVGIVGCSSEQDIISSCSAINLATRASERRSLGEKILVTSPKNLELKSKLVEYFKNCNFDAAAKQLDPPLNDPEAWIYQNNAKALTANEQPVKIVISVPITGNPDVAQEILRGVALAQHEVNSINNDTIDKNLLLVEIANDENKPEIVKDLASEFSKDSSILAVIGHNSSTASLAALPIYHQGGLVMITPTSTTTNLPVISKYIFRTTFSNHESAKVLADYITQQPYLKMAICADSQDAYANSLQAELKSLLKSKIVDIECDFNPENLNYNADKIVSQIIKKQVKGIFVIPSVNSVDKVIEIAKANTQQGRPLSLFSDNSIYQPDTLKKGGMDVEGMVLAVPWMRESKGDFETRNKNLFGTSEINWRTAMAYDAAIAVIEGLKTATTREELQKVLAKPDFSVKGATETIEFDASRERQGTSKLLIIQPQANNPQTYTFVPLSFFQ